MKSNYLKLVEDYNKRINYTENEKKFRINRLNENASEIALALVLESREYKEMKATGFKGNKPIIIDVEKAKDLILEKYQVPMTVMEVNMFLAKALESTGLFTFTNVEISYVKTMLNFTRLNERPEGFKEFNVIVDCYKLNVRDKPDLLSNIVRNLDDNTVVTVYGEIGEWYKIKDGYINKNFTRIEKSFGGIK